MNEIQETHDEECRHPMDALNNISVPSIGDAISGDGKIALQATCSSCGSEVMIHARAIEFMEMG